MVCNNVKCKYYRGPEKRDWVERQIGVTAKTGGCKYNYCKINKGRGKR